MMTRRALLTLAAAVAVTGCSTRSRSSDGTAAAPRLAAVTFSIAGMT